jgi:hypothetical protein
MKIQELSERAFGSKCAHLIPWSRTSSGGIAHGSAIGAKAKSIMFSHHIGLVIYLAFGIFGFMSIGGMGAKREGEKKTPLWRKLMAIVFWPLAMIGAIEG